MTTIWDIRGRITQLTSGQAANLANAESMAARTGMSANLFNALIGMAEKEAEWRLVRSSPASVHTCHPCDV